MRLTDGRAGDAEYGRISWVTGCGDTRRAAFRGFDRFNRGPTPVTFLSDPDKLAALKAELEEKLLQT